MSNTYFPFWQGLKKLLVDRGDGTHAERVEAYPPAKLMTDDDGPYSRIRVDVAQTGFFAGREFSTFYDFSVPNNQIRVIRVTAGVDTILQEFGFELDTAKIQLELYAGGTATGPLDVNLPILKTNNTSSASSYTSNILMKDNGTGFSGGQLVNIFRVDSSMKGVANISSDNPFGFGIGTYHIVFRNIGSSAANGIFKARWEERP